MVASLLYRSGIERVAALRDQLTTWMEEHEYDSAEQLKGNMSQRNCPDPTAFERDNYMKVLTSYTLTRSATAQ